MPAIESAVFDFGKNWISKLLGVLVESRKKREDELARIAENFGDPIELSKYYVEPDCQQFNPADFEGEEASVVREPIFRRLKTFIGHQAPNSARTLLLLSDAGMGKTSTLMMLKLGHLMAFWPQDYQCELLKLGVDSIDKIVAVVDKRSTVLLLDALDEDPMAWDRLEDRLVEILQATKAFRKVIITCRVQFLTAGGDPFQRRGQKIIAGQPCAVIYSSLLSNDQIIEFVDKRASDQGDSVEWKSRALEIVNRIGHLSMRPMLLTHMDSILESKDAIWDEYSLYRALIRVWLLREREKASQRKESYPPVEDMFRACQMLALHMQQKRTSHITNDSLYIKSAELSSIKKILRSDLGGRSLLSRNTEGGYRFSHYSIQEFLVASYLLEDSGVEANLMEVPTTDFMGKLVEVWVATASPSAVASSKIRILNLSNRTFKGVNFDGVDFSGCQFVSTKFMGCTFSKCTLVGANLKNALIESCAFDDCDLNGVCVSGGSIDACTFLKCTLANVALDESYIANSKFDESILDLSLAGARVTPLASDPATPVGQNPFGYLRFNFESGGFSIGASERGFNSEVFSIRDAREALRELVFHVSEEIYSIASSLNPGIISHFVFVYPGSSDVCVSIILNWSGEDRDGNITRPWVELISRTLGDIGFPGALRINVLQDNCDFANFLSEYFLGGGSAIQFSRSRLLGVDVQSAVLRNNTSRK